MLALSATLFLTGVCAGRSPAMPLRLRWLVPCSFGIYWLHQAVQLPLLNLCRFVPGPPLLIWLGVFCLTVIVCGLLTRWVLRKIPGIGKAF